MMKEELIQKIQEAHLEYSTTLIGLTDEQMLQPNTCGQWSGKDVVAHIPWNEQQMVEMIANRSLKGSPWWDLSLEAKNSKIFSAKKSRLPGDILKEFRKLFSDLLIRLETLSEGELDSVKEFHNVPLDWRPREVIASTPRNHYPEHTRDIQASFLKKKA